MVFDDFVIARVRFEPKRKCIPNNRNRPNDLIDQDVERHASQEESSERRDALPESSANAEINAELVSPRPGNNPINGSSPTRNLVPGTRMNSSMMRASHLNSGVTSWRSPFDSGGRTSHSGIFSSGSSICDFNRAACDRSQTD